MRPIFVFFVTGALALETMAQQPAESLKARELFYMPPPAAAKRVKPPQRPVAGNKPKPVIPSEPRPSQDTETVLVPAAYAPLALRYTILKRNGEKWEEVDPDSDFHSGDRIRIRVEANDSAYLYIVMGGSSGTWRVLFPSPDISGGNNRVERRQFLTIPPESQNPFYFDETAGTERVSLVLTREPEQDLEKLIYAAGSRNQDRVLRASIDNSVVDGLHQQMLSRDLVFEKVDETKANGATEKAMYAATPDTTAGARVFADLQLKHK